MVLSPTSTDTHPTTDPSLALRSSCVTAFSHSPLGHWWTLIFQEQAKLENALTYRLSIKLSASQAVKLKTVMETGLQALRLQLLEAFQACKATLQAPSTAKRSTLTWLETSQRHTVLTLIAQQAQWANKLKTMLPEAKTQVAETEQLAFLETVVPSVLLQPNTIRMLNNQAQGKATTSLPLTELALLEEGIHWLKATSPLGWGDLITQSLTEVAGQYTTAFPSLPTLPTERLSALLGILFLGANYYYYWVTSALSNKAFVTTVAFWETEALLFEALQFFNTGSVKTVLWHQQLEKLKPAPIKLLSSFNASAWLETLETAIASKLHATPKQYEKGKQLQTKLQAGCFISAIGDEDMQDLWATLTDPSRPIDIYACLQKITETPCDMKEMLSAVWIYQLETQVPQWLAWMETPTQDQWQRLTHQLIKHETSVLKSIETALLHKTVLGEEV